MDSKTKTSHSLKNPASSSVGLVSPEIPIFLPLRGGPTIWLGLDRLASVDDVLSTLKLAARSPSGTP